MAGLPWPGWAPPDAEAWLAIAFPDPVRAARTGKAICLKQKSLETYGRWRWDSFPCLFAALTDLQDDDPAHRRKTFHVFAAAAVSCLTYLSEN